MIQLWTKSALPVVSCTLGGRVMNSRDSRIVPL